MKTLKYILLGIVLVIIIPLCIAQGQGSKKQVLTLQCIQKNISTKLLSDSKEVMQRRMESMNLRDFRITQNDVKSELLITVGDDISRETLSDLLLMQGRMSFKSDSLLLTEQDIQEAHADYSTPAYPTLYITFKEKVWKSLEEATDRNKNKPITFAIDNKVYASPVISDKITHGGISLTGSGFSKAEVRKLAAIISGGALPLNFKVLDNK